MQGLVAELQAKAFGLAAAKEAAEAAAGVQQLTKKPPTVAVAPALTRPAPRRVQTPIKIVQEVQVGASPNYLDRTSLAQIDQEKTERLAQIRQDTIRKYAEHPTQPFNLHETKTNLERNQQQVEAKEAAALNFDMPKRRKVPPAPTAQVKLNTASVLREDALYKQKQQKEAAQIEKYESELRDCTEFYAWQSEMKTKDLAIRKEQVERTRHLARQADVNAALAMEKQRDDNARLADAIKTEGRAMGKQRKLETELKEMVNRQLVREVAHVRDRAPREAEQKVVAARKVRRAAVQAEIDELLALKVVEDQKVQAEKDERVKQLRAMHHVHKHDPKVFDPTESAGIGLLDEMSLVEMHERHAINKVMDAEAVVRKRDAIQAGKHDKQTDIARRLANIKRVREAARTANQEARERAQAQEVMKVAREKKLREGAMVVLSGELAERRDKRRAEVQALIEEEERRQNANKFLGAGTHQVEEMHFEQLLKGAEREARVRQTVAQDATRVYEATKVRERVIVQEHQARGQAAKRRLYASKAEEIEKARVEVTVVQKEEIAAKKEKFLTQRERQKRVKERVIHHNPYAESINQMSITTAKAHADKLAGVETSEFVAPRSSMSA